MGCTHSRTENEEDAANSVVPVAASQTQTPADTRCLAEKSLDSCVPPSDDMNVPGTGFRGAFKTKNDRRNFMLTTITVLSDNGARPIARCRIELLYPHVGRYCRATFVVMRENRVQYSIIAQRLEDSRAKAFEWLVQEVEAQFQNNILGRPISSGAGPCSSPPRAGSRIARPTLVQQATLRSQATSPQRGQTLMQQLEMRPQMPVQTHGGTLLQQASLRRHARRAYSSPASANVFSIARHWSTSPGRITPTTPPEDSEALSSTMTMRTAPAFPSSGGSMLPTAASDGPIRPISAVSRRASSVQSSVARHYPALLLPPASHTNSSPPGTRNDSPRQRQPSVAGTHDLAYFDAQQWAKAAWETTEGNNLFIGSGTTADRVMREGAEDAKTAQVESKKHAHVHASSSHTYQDQAQEPYEQESPLPRLENITRTSHAQAEAFAAARREAAADADGEVPLSPTNTFITDAESLTPQDPNLSMPSNAGRYRNTA